MEPLVAGPRWIVNVVNRWLQPEGPEGVSNEATAQSPNCPYRDSARFLIEFNTPSRFLTTKA